MPDAAPGEGLPTRVSVLRSDPGYRPDAWRYDAYLDGALVEYCLTADTNEGIAVAYVRDEKGCFIREGDTFRTVTWPGKVEIRRKAVSRFAEEALRGVQSEPERPPAPRFADLRWGRVSPAYCEQARIVLRNRWSVSFLRGEGRQASIFMDPSKSYYKGPYEGLAWTPQGVPQEPRHGDEADMQALLDEVAGYE